MYTLVYDFFFSSLFGGAPALSWTIGGQTVTLSEWLSHTATIIVLSLLAFVSFRFVWWLVRLVGRGFTLRG